MQHAKLLGHQQSTAVVGSCYSHTEKGASCIACYCIMPPLLASPCVPVNACSWQSMPYDRFKIE